MVTKAILLVMAVTGVALTWRTLSRKSRHRFLASYRMPDAVLKRFSAKRAALNDAQTRLVQRGLLQYFQICQRARGSFASMPSQVADDLWHEFILFTRNYEHFCRRAFGRYLHHTPVEAMSGPTQATDGIRRTWLHACRMEGIDPRNPERLPLLFALDTQLGIADGFFYSLNCRDAATSSSNAFCASDIGCGTGGSCGSGASCGGDAAGHGGSDGAHGCGGVHGCGGGCGGGGD
jgi:hypothetical protein